METVSFMIYSRDVPSFKQAAKELNIDLITEPFNQGDQCINAHAIVTDLTSLVGLAFVAGINATYMSIKNPMNKLVDELNKIVE